VSFQLREYQSRAVNQLFAWWEKHQEPDDIPIQVLPTAAGKSIIIAEVVRSMWAQWPAWHPRTVVIVPSRELAEQNAEKLVKLLPSNISVGYVSASLGKKAYKTDVIVATIGSIYKSAHLIGNIKAVLVDECHLISTKSADAGMYRKFLAELAQYCNFRCAGLTATPFRGNGVWLTDGEAPLFTGIAANVTMAELLACGYISPLVSPAHALDTRIDASAVGISNGDYKLGELADLVDLHLQKVAIETVQLASQRKKWIAFTPTVANAQALVKLFNTQGIAAVVVCGDTPKREREQLIAQFRRGEMRCLVTVVALAVGFDVPDVDCIIWCRPTKSPVLYVQGFGRGVRIAPGKTDCLVLDFTDTVERLGPIDNIKGKAMRKGGPKEAPFCICDECGARNHAAAVVCSECGAEIKHPDKEQHDTQASNAAVLSMHLQKLAPQWADVTRVSYAIHSKEGKPDSLRVDYYSGMLRAASEWVCFDHEGYARSKAEAWFYRREFTNTAKAPESTRDIFKNKNLLMHLMQPRRILIRKEGKFTQVVDYDFTRIESNAISIETAAA
jgi:DNA repair protein RadD